MKTKFLAVLAVQAVLACACAAPQEPTVAAQSQAKPAVPAFSMQDYIDVQQLYARYAHAIDTGDRGGAAWAETFTPDGAFNKTTAGRDALTAFAKNWHENRGGAQIQHWNTQLLITPTATGAQGSAYLMLVDRRTQPPSIMTVNKYEDELVRTSGGWRFKSRSFVPAPTPAPVATK